MSNQHLHQRKRKKREKAHIKEIIDRLPVGKYIELEDHVIYNTGEGYSIANKIFIDEDELVGIDWEEPDTYDEYITDESIPKTEVIDRVYDYYKKMKKIVMPGN